MPEQVIDKTKELFSIKTNPNPFELLDKWFVNSETGQKGLEEIRYVFNHIDRKSLRGAKLEFDLTLARGLDYYTGAIFEVITNETAMGSICGGGRYDDLTGVFGLKNVSGIGISFGADRLYDILLTLDRFPDFKTDGTQLLFVNFGITEGDFCEGLVTLCRRSGINTELYPTDVKMQKQMKYANAKKIQWVAMVGENEMKSSLIRLKNMESGEQQDVLIDDLIKLVSDS